MFHGEAKCNPGDQFKKSIGRELAYKRAVEAAAKDKQYKEDSVITTKKENWSALYKNKVETVFTAYLTKKGKYSRKVEIKTNKELDPRWTDHDKELVTLVNDGEGYLVKFSNGEEITLAYDQAQELTLAMKVDLQNGPFSESKLEPFSPDEG
jgi:hypothetical protein